MTNDTYSGHAALTEQEMPVSPVPWWKSSLFWRTFFLVGILLVISMGAWIYSFRLEQRGTRAKAVAEQVVSLVTITRAALVHSEPESRRELLFDLASNEGIRIYPLEPTDQIEPVTNGDEFMQAMLPYMRQKMGEDTILSPRVNDMPGFWVSFDLEEDDAYWLRLDNGRVRGISGLRWLGWGGIVLLLSLLGAGFISRLLSEPLARLAYAARQMASGKSPEPLPEKGVTEIRDANHSFNQMVRDLDITSSHGISVKNATKDLNSQGSQYLPEESLEGMQADISQMDAIVGQFLDYARLGSPVSSETVDVSSLLHMIVDEARRRPGLAVSAEIGEGLSISAREIDIRRLVNNVLTNAERYGKTSGSDLAEVDIVCRREGDEVAMVFSDRGIGVPADDLERMLRPFTRMDDARGQANGSGLGLAIVSRIAQRYRGHVRLSNRPEGGLVVSVWFPVVKSPKK